MRPVRDQTVLVTGATDGLGKALATELARAGATVIVHGRDNNRGKATLAEITTATGNHRLHVVRSAHRSYLGVVTSTYRAGGSAEGSGFGSGGRFFAGGPGRRCAACRASRRANGSTRRGARGPSMAIIST